MSTVIGWFGARRSPACVEMIMGMRIRGPLACALALSALARRGPARARPGDPRRPRPRSGEPHRGGGSTRQALPGRPRRNELRRL